MSLPRLNHRATVKDAIHLGDLSASHAVFELGCEGGFTTPGIGGRMGSPLDRARALFLLQELS